MKKIKPAIWAFLTMLFLGSLMAYSASALTYPDNTGLPDNSGGVQAILETLLKWLLGIVGIIALISFVISGLQYFLAIGDDKSMATAKKTMQYSIIGILVALSGVVAIQAIESLLKGNSTF